MNKYVVTAIVTLIQKAEEGVSYGGRGAICPACGERAYVVTTRRWSGGMRVRYHKCQNSDCLLCGLDVTIKSVQVDEAA